MMRFAIAAFLAALVVTPNPASALDKVTVGTNWLADPEAGGFYQRWSTAPTPNMAST
jgi:NitT/TauT family transport system substrate-binding protein